MAIVLAGCSQPPARPTTIAKPVDKHDAYPLASAGDNVTTLLKYADAFGKMSLEAQKREFVRISAQPRTESTRMQLALVSALPSSRYRDPERALALLEESLKAPDGRDEGLRALALLMKQLLTTQQKQEELSIQLTQKLKDEQKRSDTLQQKLEELMAVEKTLNERRKEMPR
jgi:hypothetical protein